MAERYGWSGKISNITRFPGYFAPETRKTYGTIIRPGEKTLYDAYGPVLDRRTNTWQGEWFFLCRVPSSVRERICELCYMQGIKQARQLLGVPGRNTISSNEGRTV